MQLKQFIDMTQKDTLNKTYGNIPKEVSVNISFFDFELFRGLKLIYLKLKRKVR